MRMQFLGVQSRESIMLCCIISWLNLGYFEKYGFMGYYIEDCMIVIFLEGSMDIITKWNSFWALEMYIG